VSAIKVAQRGVLAQQLNALGESVPRPSRSHRRELRIRIRTDPDVDLKTRRDNRLL
jgi:hypothetical protein